MRWRPCSSIISNKSVPSWDCGGSMTCTVVHFMGANFSRFTFGTHVKEYSISTGEMLQSTCSVLWLWGWAQLRPFSHLKMEQWFHLWYQSSITVYPGGIRPFWHYRRFAILTDRGLKQFKDTVDDWGLKTLISPFGERVYWLLISLLILSLPDISVSFTTTASQPSPARQLHHPPFSPWPPLELHHRSCHEKITIDLTREKKEYPEISITIPGRSRPSRG